MPARNLLCCLWITSLAGIACTANTTGEGGGAGAQGVVGGNVAGDGGTSGTTGGAGDGGTSGTTGGTGDGGTNGTPGGAASSGGGAEGVGAPDGSVMGGGALDGGDGSSGAGGGGNSFGPTDVFRAATRFAVVDPLDFDAVGDGSVDDTDALQAAIDSVPPEGGIVLFSEGSYWKERALLRVQTDHVLFWAPNGRATVHATVRALTEEERNDDLCGVREQAIVFDHTQGGGIYGLRFTSNAVERTSCAEDSQVVLNGVDGFDLVGSEISGAPSTGFFAWSSNSADPPSQNLFVEGNYFHHSWADSVHHTRGTRRSACWRNFMFNEAPSLGDDGIACVTYGVDSARCGEMEWWDNIYLGGLHGRGMAVIGGEDISIHHNWIVGSASAGLIVASEGAYDSASSERIELSSNYLVDSPNGSVNNGHSAILISGGNDEAPPLRDIQSSGNVIVDAAGDRVERAEGQYDTNSVTFDDSTDVADLPGPVPTLEDVELEDTSILRTRDVSFVVEGERRGLYRIHLREGANGIEERFEYVVRGPSALLEDYLEEAMLDLGVYVSEMRSDAGTGHALILSPVPLVIPAELAGVSFDDLRDGDRSGALSWLWQRIDRGEY